MKKSLIAIACVALLAGCTKKDDATPTVTGAKNILTGGSSKSWLISKIELSVNGITTDMTSNWPSCLKDNISTLTSAGVYIQDEGASKCNTTDAQSSTGTYSISADETEITLNDPIKGAATAKLLSVSSTSFKEAFTQTANGITTVTTTTFVAK